MEAPPSKRPISDDEQGPNKEHRIEVHTFPMYPLSKYNGNCAVYKQPIEIQSYSIDHERTVHFDDRQLKYYLAADLSDANLSSGYDKFIQRDADLKEHIDTLLDALTHLRTNKNTDPASTKAKIITWRGIVTKLLCAPYTKEPFELGATLFNDTIYIEEHETEYKRSQNQGQNPRQQLMGYWGYKFETLSTMSKFPDYMDASDKEELETRKLASANTNEQYCTVVKTKLGNTSLIMGAEVDCTSAPKVSGTNPLSNYIELKTSKVIESSRDQHTFERYKLLKFWAQSFLVGTPAVICGFRDNDGYVRKIHKLKTMEMPRIVRSQHGMWDARICVNFADQFLSWLQKVITIDDPEHTYNITFQQPYQEIRIRSSGKKNVFLTQRYLEGNTSDKIGGPRVGE